MGPRASASQSAPLIPRRARLTEFRSRVQHWPAMRFGAHCACALLAAPLPACRQDVPIEYSGEEQAIVAVGLARPKPGVFVEAIQHLLVLCTTTEVGGQGSDVASARQGCWGGVAGSKGSCARCCDRADLLLFGVVGSTATQGPAAAVRWQQCDSLCAKLPCPRGNMAPSSKPQDSVSLAPSRWRLDARSHPSWPACWYPPADCAAGRVLLARARRHRGRVR